jgi:hypothetical protein
MAAWIWIRIPNEDPDPGGLKRAKKQTITGMHKKYFVVKQCNW